MKNGGIWLVICFLIIVSCFGFVSNGNLIFSDEVYKDDVIYTFHVSDIDNINDDIMAIQNGNEYILKCDYITAKNLKPSLRNIVGETISYKSTFENVFDVINNFDCKVVYTEKFNDIYTFYGYSNKIDLCSYVNNQKVNIEIAFNKGIVTIGSPIILGDY